MFEAKWTSIQWKQWKHNRTKTTTLRLSRWQRLKRKFKLVMGVGSLELEPEVAVYARHHDDRNC